MSTLEKIPDWVKPKKKRGAYEFPGDWVKLVNPGRGIRWMFLARRSLPGISLRMKTLIFNEVLREPETTST